MVFLIFWKIYTDLKPSANPPPKKPVELRRAAGCTRGYSPQGEHCLVGGFNPIEKF